MRPVGTRRKIVPNGSAPRRSANAVIRSTTAGPISRRSTFHGGSPPFTHEWPILICLLGTFHVLKQGHPVEVPLGGKVEALLGSLAVESGYALPRERLLESLWPGTRPQLAGQSLNSLVYGVYKALGDAIGGARPVVHAGGAYRLHTEAGVGTDVALFDALIAVGDRLLHTRSSSAALRRYEAAAALYRGDLSVGTNLSGLLERERLRAHYLLLLVRLADIHFGKRAYDTALHFALRVAACDACREDAHRMAMRCYVKLGERAQAFRQYRLCEQILRSEFDANPEPATRALYDQIRSTPNSV